MRKQIQLTMLFSRAGLLNANKYVMNALWMNVNRNMYATYYSELHVT